jgi:hypothetical protein
MTPPDTTGSVGSRPVNSYDFDRFCVASAIFFSPHFYLAGIAAAFRRTAAHQA